MQAEYDPRRSDQRRERGHDDQHGRFIGTVQDREADGMQRMSGRKAVTIQRWCSADDLPVGYERPLAHEPFLEELV